jgi:hypothetical protein
LLDHDWPGPRCGEALSLPHNRIGLMGVDVEGDLQKPPRWM